MKTFFNILQTISNITNKTYPDDPFNLLLNNTEKICNNEHQSYIKYLINTIYKNINVTDEENVTNKCYACAKFNSLNCFSENTFLKEELKEQLLSTFSTAQKHYYAFSKLSRYYRLKKNPIVVSSDLMLNPLEISHINTFILIQNKSTYLFGIHDLISIIENAIGNTDHFFSEPLWPRNPYNNQLFDISTLYNIYFKMKESPRIMSTLFHLFFLENFSRIGFSEKHEVYIRDYAIKQFVFNSPANVLSSSILKMLASNFYTRRLHIDPEFPKDTLASIFRPFLYYYYIINYDISCTMKVENYTSVLYKKLKSFYEFNPAFGRKIIKLTRGKNNCKKIVKQEYEFVTNHCSFYKIHLRPRNIHSKPNNIEFDFNNGIVNNNDLTQENDELDEQQDEQQEEQQEEQVEEELEEEQIEEQVELVELVEEELEEQVEEELDEEEELEEDGSIS
jgi:hypothetical protein